MNPRIRRFTRDDFVQYRSWYADPALNEQLGPMDEDWLAAVLGDKEGMQYSYFENERLVAVLGISLHPVELAWVLTDIAIDPALKRQGIGQRALRAVMAIEPREHGDSWMAYVMPDNLPACRFFAALGWPCTAPGPDDEMLTYRHRRQH